MLRLRNRPHRLRKEFPLQRCPSFLGPFLEEGPFLRSLALGLSSLPYALELDLFPLADSVKRPRFFCSKSSSSLDAAASPTQTIPPFV